MTVDQLVAVAQGIVQFDWGDFFFCKTKTTAESIHESDPYAAAIAKAEVTLRCVDDSFFYIYGTDPRLFLSVRNAVSPADSKQGELAELDFPE